MINTLRITTFIAAVLAVVFLMLSVAFGLREDPEIQQFLKSPGVIEQYKAGSAVEKEKPDLVSPLMQQAQAFAKRIEPPPKPKRIISRPTTKPVARPERVRAKFSLIGTAVCLFDPLRSMALIDEPGKGPHWVMLSDKVGHLIIDHVGDGNITVRDGERAEVLYAKHPEKKSLLKNPPKVAPAADSPRKSKPTRGPSMPKPSSPGNLPPKSQPGEQQAKAAPEKTMEQQRESMGISSEEAEDLGDLGSILKAMEEQILRMEMERKGAEAPSAANEPNR